MTNDEAVEKIHEIIKEQFGDGVSVNIFVNSEGINCNVNYKPYPSRGCSMRNINGEWLEKQEKLNGTYN